MSVPFTKASACGNDFLIIERQHVPADDHGFTKSICDRHNGVGADGVEWLSLQTEKGIDAAIHLINADGSDAEISGNGTRCVAALLAAKGADGILRISTGAGVKTCRLISREGNSFQFETEMGAPKVDPQMSIKVSYAVLTGIPVSMGNPHFVGFTESFPANWQAQAAEIQQQHKVFAHGVNVEFVRIAGPNAIEVRFFERGAGETLSSGTGSCASAVAAISAGKVKSPVAVVAPGGTQSVRWDSGTIYLTGPAQLICTGEFLG